MFRRNWIFRHTFCINNPDWQSGGIKIFLCKCFIVISDILIGTFLDVLVLMLAVILPGLLEKPRRNKDWVHALLSMSLFMLFFVYSLPLSEWRTCWMFPIKIYSVAMEGILCDDIMSERSKIWKSLKYLAI